MQVGGLEGLELEGHAALGDYVHVGGRRDERKRDVQEVPREHAVTLACGAWGQASMASTATEER